jgi:hypothetical protein
LEPEAFNATVTCLARYFPHFSRFQLLETSLLRLVVLLLGAPSNGAEASPRTGALKWLGFIMMVCHE